ncbi:hypothetical protein BDV93DRAFT_517092 [Ceratobasidium sp. AG-I]|nr:hypothetical protein BDV93DRAFT_517092 [Ceratobasidium sp. AG-I]
MGIRRAAFGRFVGAQSSEAARREQMKPVSCWEKQWIIPTGSLPGSEFKVLKWVKVDRVQEFSDDEAEEDAPLAPILDIPETVEIDDDEDAGTPTRALPDQDSRISSEQPADPTETESDPQSPAPSLLPPRGPRKPHPLSMSQLPGEVAALAEPSTDLDSAIPSAIDNTPEEPSLPPLTDTFVEQEAVNLGLGLMDQTDESAMLGMDDPGIAGVVQRHIMEDAPAFGTPEAGDGILLQNAVLEDGKLVEDEGVGMILQ